MTEKTGYQYEIGKKQNAVSFEIPSWNCEESNGGLCKNIRSGKMIMWHQKIIWLHSFSKLIESCDFPEKSTLLLSTGTTIFTFLSIVAYVTV